MGDDGHADSTSVDDIRNHSTGGAVRDDGYSHGQMEENRERAGP